MSSAVQPTALIADDEPLLRDSLARSLAQTWPELRILAQARKWAARRWRCSSCTGPTSSFSTSTCRA